MENILVDLLEKSKVGRIRIFTDLRKKMNRSCIIFWIIYLIGLGLDIKWIYLISCILALSCLIGSYLIKIKIELQVLEDNINSTTFAINSLIKDNILINEIKLQYTRKDNRPNPEYIMYLYGRLTSDTGLVIASNYLNYKGWDWNKWKERKEASKELSENKNWSKENITIPEGR